MKLSEINKHGAKSYLEDRGLYRNPYPIGSPEFNEFERGWMQSLKRKMGFSQMNALPSAPTTGTAMRRQSLDHPPNLMLNATDLAKGKSDFGYILH